MGGRDPCSCLRCSAFGRSRYLASGAVATPASGNPREGVQSPWQRVVAGAGAPIPATLARLGYGPAERFGALCGYVHRSANWRQIRIERHPLWQDEHPARRAALAEARNRYPGYEVKAISPFRLLRRPADAV